MIFMFSEWLMLHHQLFYVCDLYSSFTLFTLVSLIPYLAKFGKVPIQATWPHSISLNCTLHSLNHQASTFPLGTRQWAVPTSQSYALCNLSAQPQPLISRIVQPLPLVILFYALHSLEHQALGLTSWTAQLCNPLASIPLELYNGHLQDSSPHSDLLSSSTMQMTSPGLPELHTAQYQGLVLDHDLMNYENVQSLSLYLSLSPNSSSASDYHEACYTRSLS